MKKKISLKNLFSGVCIGVSNIIPGVSGGTTAVILGIYEELINSIGNLKKDSKGSMKFLIQIAIGAIIGILGFSGIISFLLEKYTLGVNYLFVGLVIGSIGMITSKIDNKKINLKKVLGFVLGVVIVALISFVGGTMSQGSVTESSNMSYLTLGFAGFVTALTMILPGVSGSLSLVMLGLYDDFVLALSTFNIPYLIAGAVGGLIGLVLTVKLISYLLKNYKDTTYAAILGLVIGSIIVIISSNPVGSSVIVPLFATFAGVLITTTLSKIA